MLQLKIENARLPDATGPVTVAAKDGRVVDIAPQVEGEAERVIDAAGQLLAPPFVDPHFHMDATLSLGTCPAQRLGHAARGHRALGRAEAAADARGGDRARDPLLRPRRRAGPARDPQPCRCLRRPADRGRGAARGPPPRRPLDRPAARRLPAGRPLSLGRRPRRTSLRALDMGVDVVGGIPHFERTMADGAASVRRLCEIAAERGLMVDHALRRVRRPDVAPCRDAGRRDDSARPAGPGGGLAPDLAALGRQLLRASKLIPLIAEAGLHAIPNPLINITLQGRHDGYPRGAG